MLASREKASVAITAYGKNSLPTQNTLPWRYHSCDLWSDGFYRPFSRLGTQPPSKPHYFNDVFAPNSKHRAELSYNKAKQRKQEGHRKPDDATHK